MDLFLIFITGLTVGGLTCMAVQGGLLAALISEREKETLKEERSKKETLLPTIAFLAAKLVAYTILGFLLGLVGSAFSISEKFQSFVQLFAGVYILIIALNLLNVHPIFRYAIIQTPKFIARKIRNTSKSRDAFAPALMGFFAVFIPCGTTLAMETLAITSGNPFKGALIMFVFVLGTVPIFLGLGYITTLLGNTFKTRFLKLAAIILVYLGITSINGALTALGSSFTLQNLGALASSVFTIKKETKAIETVPVINGFQTAEIGIYPTGYSPNYIRVKANQPVRLNLIVKGNLGCTAFFRIPELGIKADLVYTGAGVVEFTPQRTGKIRWTCSMGMYDGVIEVI